MVQKFSPISSERPGNGVAHRLATTTGTVTEVSSNQDVFRFECSNEDVDLAGDIVFQNWTNLAAFEKNNPVALYCHDSFSPPIGRWKNMKVATRADGKRRLLGDLEFASSQYPLAATLANLVRGKFLRAVSVGFKPEKMEYPSDKTRPNGSINFLQSQLLEISLCAIPMNSGALIQEARSAGIDLEPVMSFAERQREARVIEARRIAANVRALLSAGR